tara:strand:- start:302 stop:541 length:240 start_codon:yes stop_codon:yes gene_type:complete
MIKIGKSDVEQSVDELKLSREIVKEILDFGINQQQILRTIYLLSLELENREAMMEISSSLKKYLENLSNPKENEVITLQ